MKFTDFHFEFNNLGDDATGDGGGFFKQVESHRSGTTLHCPAPIVQELDFYMGEGTGIPYCTNFRITTTGFGDLDCIYIHPSVPEPSTILLFGVGFLALLGAAGIKKRG